MPKITLIDDEHGPMDFYVKALRQSGFEVEHLDTVADALKHIADTPTPSDLYIIDLMMPVGDSDLKLEEASFGLSSGIEITRALREAGQKEIEQMSTTSFGLDAGLAIHRRLRARFVDVPIIILTSLSNPRILRSIPFDRQTTREAKIEVLPFELVEKVRDILNATQHE